MTSNWRAAKPRSSATSRSNSSPGRRFPICARRSACGDAAGKDYLSDKPAMTTLEHLAEVRNAIKETGRMFADHVLRAAGSAGGVQAARSGQSGGDRQGGADRQYRAASGERDNRPAWFWDPERMAESSPTSARTRPTSSSTTRGRRLPTSRLPRSPMCTGRNIPSSRISAT